MCPEEYECLFINFDYPPKHAVYNSQPVHPPMHFKEIKFFNGIMYIIKDTMIVLQSTLLIELALHNLEIEVPLCILYFYRQRNADIPGTLIPSEDNRVLRFKELFDNTNLIPTQKDIHEYGIVHYWQKYFTYVRIMILFLKHLLTFSESERNIIYMKIFFKSDLGEMVFDFNEVKKYVLATSRLDYIMLYESYTEESNHIARYLFDDNILKEICSFYGPEGLPK